MSKTATTTDNTAVLKDGPLNVYKYRWLLLGLSALLLIPGVYFIIVNMMDPNIQAPLRLGVDFRGGTMLEYGFSRPIAQKDVEGIHAVFDKYGYTGSVIQIQQPRAGINQKAVEIGKPSEAQPETAKTAPAATTAAQTPAGESTAVTKPADATVAQPGAQSGEPVSSSVAEKDGQATDVATIVSVRSKHLQGEDDTVILRDLQAQYGPITVLQKNSIGPALAKELLGNGLLALVLAYILIVGYLTFRFQFDYAVCAMLALAHDTLFLIGIFAMFGQLYHTEIDSLFITAVLTVVGFSVHDTIVVFDRIRENVRVYFTKKIPFTTIVNMSVNQTLARSINTSLTTLLTMVALYFFGGETTKDFVLAIIIGITAGMYSSIFNASVMLAMWRNRGEQQQAQGGVPATA